MNHTEDALSAALGYLNRALPLADRVTLSVDTLERVARHALMVRKATPWGESVPVDVFAPFVLFPRVNNEDPCAYHASIWAALRDRVRGLDMKQAALEINRWCFEQATYQSTDGRTANALTVMRRGFGRCGEESVLLVSALRACGIPARQVYVPLWSHCDDNHAWVEVWVDGAWHYMGACEPELALDSGWFTAAASKAMLVHTRSYAILPEGERAENHLGEAWVINRTAAYARTRLLTVYVRENGAPKPGVRVAFEVCNMAAWHPICEKATGMDGRADLLTGLGTLLIRVTDGRRGCETVVDVARQPDVLIDFTEAHAFAEGVSDFDQRPPLESRMQPANFPEAELAAHEAYLAGAEKARLERFALPEGADPLIRSARGNRQVIEDFLANARFEEADKRDLLASLKEKDLVDVTPEVLSDALTTALPAKRDYPREIWVEGVLCPRVWVEMLYPVRERLRTKLFSLRDPAALWAELCAKLSRCEMEPARLMPDLANMLERGWGSEKARDVLFVAAARALGMAARLDPATGEKQVWRDGDWHALLPGRQASACLVLRNGAETPLTCGVHFAVAALENGAFRPLALENLELPKQGEIALKLAPGKYRITTASRQIDGSVEGRRWQVALAEGETRAVTLTLRPDATAEKLARVELPPLTACHLEQPVRLPEAFSGKPSIVALIAPAQEPTEHFLNELLEAKDALRERGVAVCLLVNKPGQLANEKLQAVLREVPGATALHSPDPAAVTAWREALNARELRLPFAAAIGQSGRGLFAFVNYNVGSVMTLLKVIEAE